MHKEPKPEMTNEEKRAYRALAKAAKRVQEIQERKQLTRKSKREAATC